MWFNQSGLSNMVLTVTRKLARVEMASSHGVEVLELGFAGGGDVHLGGGEETTGSSGVGGALGVA